MDGDGLIRTLSNFYKAAFERATPKLNTILSVFTQNNENQLAMTEGSGQFFPLKSRYYADLVVTAGTGITYNAGGTTASRIQYGAGILTAAQGWFATRIVPSWAYNDGVAHYMMSWKLDATHYIVLFHDTDNNWKVKSYNAGTADVALVAASHAVSGHVTLIGAWTASGLKISLNGAAFVTASRADGTPNLAAATAPAIDIGSQAAATKITATVDWVMAGDGTLTDADAVTINAFGDTAPVYGTTLDYLDAYNWGMSFLWAAVTAAHDALSNRYGETNYAA